MAGSVRLSAALGLLVVVAAALAGVLYALDPAAYVLPWWSALVAVGVTAAVAGLVVRRCVRRFGGVTGDVLGAVVESSLATSTLTLVATLP